jgi:hypothetical protein
MAGLKISVPTAVIKKNLQSCFGMRTQTRFIALNVLNFNEENAIISIKGEDDE